ncbi:N-acyl homoserine lactonase family protein [Tersicoccus sp. Bi-70]|uniref:N-acyl homoserine lactonase family protein n=1 Tax=Tersicoccus sp. Bi-70 TaxID=1897634 RepID=UPI000978790C|nr:N-acyl homoserine lactonase family protein [Tersicoccus sp. Bi-70]OMH37100.1 hypothetical protein BGP79_15575 [Tersicoccus sp. Bi-70]
MSETRADPWEVLAVRHGRLLTTRADFFLNYGEYGQPDAPLELGYWFWIVRNGTHTIVVDTGFSAGGARSRGREVTLEPATALAALGIDAGTDVQVVITHAHYDHAGNLDLFPTQPVYLHAAETAFWLGPDAQHRQFRGVVDEADLSALERVVASGRAVRIDEQREIAAGVSLVPLPGHTPGQLAVVVETPRGRIVLASDACHLDEELEEDMPFKHNTDLIGLYRGLARLRDWQQSGDLVIPGHEPTVLQRFPGLGGALAGHAVRLA